jgi:hypothetical protein
MYIYNMNIKKAVPILLSAGIYSYIKLKNAAKKMKSKNNNTLKFKQKLTEKIPFYTDKQSYYKWEEINIYLIKYVDKVSIHINDFDKNLYLFTQKLKKHSMNKPDQLWKNKYYQAYCSITLPKNIKSGIYNININGWLHPIVVKNKFKNDITIVYPTNTINAYNDFGGKNIYYSFLSQPANSIMRAKKVTFKRPINQKQIFEHETEFIKELNSNYKDYNINYIIDSDLDNYAAFDKSKLLIIIGHNEYLTNKAIDHIESFVENGNNLLVLSGNTAWWQVRYEGDLMICYKESQLDPINDSKFKTINFPKIRNIYHIFGLDFTFGGYGMAKSHDFNTYKKSPLYIDHQKTDIDFNYEKTVSGYNKDNLLGKQLPGFGGFKIINENIIFKNIIQKNEILKIPTKEYDGIKIKEFNKELVPDIAGFKYYKVLGYDISWRTGITIGGFIICQRNNNSGIVINTGTTDWCSQRGMGGIDGDKLKKISKNMIDLLLKDDNKNLLNESGEEFCDIEYPPSNSLKNNFEEDYQQLLELKEIVTIDLIGNGDQFESPNDIKIIKFVYDNHMKHCYIKYYKDNILPVIGAVIEYPKTSEEYYNLISKSQRRMIRKAIKNKFKILKNFQHDDYLDDIYQINISKKSRQSRPMPKRYMKYPKKEGKDIFSNSKYYNFFRYGCFIDNKLVAYCFPYICNETVFINKVLGHGDYLKYGIMNLLFYEIGKNMIKNYKNIKYFFYLDWFSDTGGLTQFKKSMYFRPKIIEFLNIYDNKLSKTNLIFQ